MSKTLCFVSRIEGSAGPAGFQTRLSSGLERRGFLTAFDLESVKCDAVLVIGGTRRLDALAGMKQAGIPIIQRLNGINWIHRREATGLRHFLRAEVNNLLMRVVRSRLADFVVYQSQFVADWWEKEFGPPRCPYQVIYNGVPLDEYSPEGSEKPPDDRWLILVVEGNMAGGYEIGLRWARSLAETAAASCDRPLELAVAGQVSKQGQASLAHGAGIQVRLLGPRPPAEIPGLDRAGHALFAADLHPACPNSVIEALACGLPVVSFDTGALPELVRGDSGRIVSYGGNPWKLDPPDIESLARATLEIFEGQTSFRRGARARAEAHYGLERMVESYLQVLGWS